MEITYDWFLVPLSYIIAVLGSYAGLNLAIRIPGAKPGKELIMWLIMSAAAIGGVAIWSMHYIGMLAVDMDMPVSYGLPLTILSMVIAIVVVAIGLAIVGRGEPSIAKLLGGGVVTGLGVAAMHYTGMSSMNMAGEVSYDTTLFVLSLVIAVVAAIAALWLAFNLRGSAQRIGSAFIMGIAVCGMHYTGMAAMKVDGMAMDSMMDDVSASNISYGPAIAIFLVASAILGGLMYTASQNSPKRGELVFGV